jgi:hypothetical protein
VQVLELLVPTVNVKVTEPAARFSMSNPVTEKDQPEAEASAVFCRVKRVVAPEATFTNTVLGVPPTQLRPKSSETLTGAPLLVKVRGKL